MRQNLADIVEDHILKLLREQKDGQIEIQRGDIANEMACAPSQVTYVLTTRFTRDRGFTVESRRGLGGFIRISIIPLRSFVFDEILRDFDANATIVDARRCLQKIYDMQYITKREVKIVSQIISSLFASETISSEERYRVLNTIFRTLEKV